GDGNFHPVVLYDERDPDETERMHAANFEIMKVAVKLGGTLTGEHGVGRLKLRGMPLMFGKEEMLFMNELKRAFDPEGVLNPGKVIPPEVLNGRVRGFIDSRVEKAPVEVLEVLSEAGAKGLQVVPTGSGTKLSVGPRQDTPEGSVRLESRGLPKIIDLDRENLTARVSAGVTLKEFQEVLGEDGFFFPADPYWSDSATLGGIVATGDNGSYRYRYGEVRDFVLGVSAVLADGRRLRFGCRTVKNVAGFDVKKLLIGSWGTLGVLIDFTVRVFPKPEPTTVKISFPMIEDLTEFFLEGRQRNHIAPAALEFAGFDPREELGATGDLLTEKEELALVLRFDSSGKATRPQLERLSRMAGEAGAGFETLDSETAQAFWAGRTTVARRLLAGGNTTWLRIGYPLGGFAELYQDLTRMVDEVGAGLALWAHLGNGIADAFIRPRGEIGEITALSKALRQKGGSVYPMFCGPARKALESLYHQRDDGRLASRVKRLFDPANRFGLFRV
ncbi:MAG: FAD-binding oxidoreductase, partial [Actinobacteria bacterium]|nr:FAD-binding oxidoreductase [Actinomycetota bacterium]